MQANLMMLQDQYQSYSAAHARWKTNTMQSYKLQFHCTCRYIDARYICCKLDSEHDAYTNMMQVADAQPITVINGICIGKCMMQVQYKYQELDANVIQDRYKHLKSKANINIHNNL